jgi:UDP-glucose 4-epimerase
MSLDDAIDLVFYAIVHGQNGDTLIKKAPASTVKDLATAICEILKQGTIQPNYIGIRHGEKMHESLISEEEVRHAQDKSGFFQIPIDKRGVNFGEFVDSGDVPGRQLMSYSSNNTKQLAVTEIIHMLEKNVEFNVLAKTVLK